MIHSLYNIKIYLKRKNFQSSSVSHFWTHDWLLFIIFPQYNMRNEICRRCGEDTTQIEKCTICHQVIKSLCPECNVVFDSYHSKCTEIDQLGKIVIE